MNNSEVRLDRFPFFTGGHSLIGFTGDWTQVFLYTPLNASGYGASIRSEGVSPPPNEGDLLNLCLPFHLNDEFLDQCAVRWVSGNSSSWQCGGALVNRTPLRYPLFLDFVHGVPLLGGEEMSKLDALEHVQYLLRDACFTKRAIQIYFSHMMPFFSRSANEGRGGHLHYEQHLYQHMEAQIGVNLRRLEVLLDKAMACATDLQRIKDPGFIQEYRTAVFSEISAEPLKQSFEATVVNRYLHSIRLTEHKLALNYNTFLLIQHWMV